jgi:hypothetical protein
VKKSIALTFAALTLAGCSATSDTTATLPSFDAPKVTAAGTSPISPSKQPVFCQDQVAAMHDAEPQNVVTTSASSQPMARQRSTSLSIR